MKNFFGFQTMFTPRLIKILYPIYLLVMLGLSMWVGLSENQGILGFLAGFITFLVFGLVGRVIAEHLIIIFSIHEILQKNALKAE